MPPRKKNSAQKIADILAKFNIEAPVEIPEANYNSNNAVAMFAKVPEHFVQGQCMECKQLFAHNQPIPAGTRVGYCSDGCRKKAFKKSTGLDWGAVNSDREPWDGDPPMIITPEQYKNLEKIADWFSRNRTTLEIQDQIVTESVSEELDENLGDSQFPKDQEPSLVPDFDFDAPLVSELANQYPGESRTNPLPSLDFSEPLLNSEEASVFDF